MAKTLEELKAENAQTETVETETPQVEEEVVDVEASEVETEEVAEVEAEPEPTEDEEAEPEAWQLTDEQTSDDNVDGGFSGRDIAAAKHKLRAKLEKKHNSELEALKAEIEALKGGQVNRAQPISTKPKREDFYGADDPDEAFFDALTDWKLEQRNAQSTAQTQADQYRKSLDDTVGKHYERAVELAEKSGISAEVYQNSDLAVRSMIERIRPNQGDLIADQLISTLGEGSEKVMYYLGRNANALAQLEAALLRDPSGMQASVLLGRKLAEVTQPQKRVSRAPAPPKQIQGDSGQGEPANVRKLREKYSNAHKKGQIQSAYNVKKEAKAAGVDVSNW
jgi:hypothetical protein